MPLLSPTAPTEALLGAASIQPHTAGPPRHSQYWVCTLPFSNLAFFYTKKQLLSFKQAPFSKRAPPRAAREAVTALTDLCPQVFAAQLGDTSKCWYSKHTARDVRDLLPLAPVQVQPTLTTALLYTPRHCWQDNILSPMYPSGTWC